MNIRKYSTRTVPKKTKGNVLFNILAHQKWTRGHLDAMHQNEVVLIPEPTASLQREWPTC